MPANPKDLYNELKKAGEISVTYEQFRKKWDTPGWNVDFHKALRKKQLTSLSYNDFVYAFGEDDPDYQTIELSQAELDAAGKEKVEPYPQLGPTKDTDSSGENTSWASPEKIQAIRERFGKETEAQDSSLLTQEEVDGLNTYIQELDKTPVEKVATPQKIANIQKVFGGKPQEEQAVALSLKQLNDVEKFVESLPDEGGIIPKNYSIVERGLDALLINMPTGLETAWESSKALLVNTVGNPQFYGIPKSVDLPEPLAEARDEYVVSQLSKVQELNKQVIDTGSLVGGYKEGDAQEFFGGVFNATQGVLSTVIPAMLTSGASLVPQVIAPTWTDYQITKAEAKYGDQEDPIAALIENNDVDNVVPLTIGAGMLVLEKAGFKGISKYIAGTKTGRKLMGIDTNKIAFLLTTNKEGITEWGQLGLEKINEALAEGKDLKTATASAYDTMFSADGLENYLQGMVGSGIITAPSAIDRTITRALHEDPDGHKIITGGIDAIAELKERRLQAGSKQVRDMYDKDIKDIENTIKSVLKENNKLVKHLTPQEDAKLRTILKKKDKIAKDISLLNEALAKGEIDAKERGYGVRRLNAENIKLSEDIAALKESIDKSKIYADVSLAQKLSKKVNNIKFSVHDTPEGVLGALKGAINEKGELYSDQELQDFATTSAGLFWTDSNGVEHIVVNSSESLKSKLTTTSQHEFLHKVLSKVLKADPNLAGKLAGSLKSSLKNLEKEGNVVFKQHGDTELSKFEVRQEAYENDPAHVQAEEYLTILSEMLTTGDVKIKEAPKSFLGKVKELIRRTFLDLGITTVNLEGDGVLQFIKDYNREFARGKLSRATTKVIRGDINALLSPSSVKQSLNAAPVVKWNKSKDEVFGEILTSSTFDVGDQKYNILITPDTPTGGLLAPGKGDPKFGELTFNNVTKGVPTRSLMGNTKSVMAVFGAVINGAKQAIKNEGLDGITFTANDEGRRAIVYGAIAGKIANDMGWRLDIEPNYGAGMTRFVMSKPKGGLKQSKSTKDLYETTNDIYSAYKDDKQTAGFLIALEWENQIRSLARKYRNLPGYNDTSLEDLISNTQHEGSQSILGLVKSYKPNTKTTDGENIVSLPGYINKWLPQYIQGKLHSVGIGEVEEQGGYTADISEQKGLAAEETAEDIITTEAQAQEQEIRKYPKMKDALNLGEHPEVKDYITKRIALNISSAISLYGKAKTINTKTDAFVKAVKKGIQDDEKSLKVIKKFIKDYGYEKFLVDFKETILGNYTTTVLAKHPFYRQATQKRIKGVWKSPEAVVFNGKVKYEYLMDDGTIYPARHPDFDRDKAAQTGHTAGHFKIRRNPNVGNSISTNAFVDYHFNDGAGRKSVKDNPLESMGMQFASEVGFELLEEQLLEREGEIYDAFASRVQLTKEMTEEQKDKAIKQGLIIREGMAEVLTDRGIAETLKDLDRGGIKQSKVNKTGHNWFDRPRIDMTNYLASLENNEVREGVVSGLIGSPDFDMLRSDMKEAYDMYLGMLEYKEDWTYAQQKYAEAFQDKNYKTFEEFVENSLNQTTTTIDGILGLQPGDTSFGSKNSGKKAVARKEGVEGFINDKLKAAENKGEALAEAVNLLVGATSGSLNSALYLNTPGFFAEVVVPAIEKYKIKDKFDLVEIDGGTTITHNGNKVTTSFSRGVYSDDTFNMFEEVAESGKVLINKIDAKGRVEEAKRAGAQYKEYIEWIQDNKSRLSPTTIGMMLKGFQARSRSVAQIMHPVTEIMLLDNVNEITEYTTLPSIPAVHVSRVALNFILTGKNKAELNKVIDEGITAILPKTHANVVDQFHFDTPINDFYSDKVNNKLEELGEPQIKTTPLLKSDTIIRQSKSSIRFSKKVNKEAEKIVKASAVGTSMAFTDMVNKAGGFKTGERVPSGIAHLRGKRIDAKFRNKYKLFLSPEAEDFMGLMYNFLGKKKQGNQDKEFINRTLVTPYLEGIKKLDEIKTQVADDYKAVLKKHKAISNKLHSIIPGDIKDKFTYDQAIRYYLYNKAGYGEMLEDDIDSRVNVVRNGKKSKMPASAFTGPSATALLNAGVEILTDTPAGAMLSLVINDSDILEFTESLSTATKLKEGYVKPLETWLSRSSLATDFRDLVGKEYRGKMLKGFISNVELMFTPQNLNKIETAFGTRFRKALFNESPTAPGVIQRMMGGRHAMAPASKLVNWVNGAIAPIMFLNRRSALMQLLSATNFINLGDNNPLKAAQAFANRKQFAADFNKIMYSPKLKERRSGLKYSVEEAELANVGGTEGFWEVFKARTIKLGFSLTQAADSFAIAFGGASFYRNRVNSLMKMIDKNGNKVHTKESAEEQAWLDFSKTADEAQQSSDQMLLSAEQTRGLGRLILAFSNTPAQYTRIMVKAARDLKNGRGDYKTNISKILYYGAIQNLIFTFTQLAAFATWDLFDGDDDEDKEGEKKVYDNAYKKYTTKLSKDGKRTYTDEEAKKKAEKDVEEYKEEREEFANGKKARVATGMVDNVLRGAGLRGAAISSIYHTAISAMESLEKPMLDTGAPVIKALGYSPPLSKKANQLRSLLLSQKYNKEIKSVRGWKYDSPNWMDLGTAVELTTNLPGSWVGKIFESAAAITSKDEEISLGEKAIIGLGWRPYDLGITNTEHEKIKAEVKAQEKLEKAALKAAEKEVKKQLEQARLAKRTPAEVRRDELAAQKKNKERAKKAAATRKKNEEAKKIELWKSAQEAARNRRKQD
jgi:hypothetical protein